MKFVAISDTHFRHQQVKLPKGDVLLHAGDLTYRGRRAELAEFLQWMGRQPHAHKVFIAGNHDFFLEKAEIKEWQSLIPEGVTYLNDSGITLGGVRIWGSPVTPWFYNWAFNRHRGAPIRKHWDLIPSDTDLLITHGPPFGILDTTVKGDQTGCKDLLAKVQAVKPKVHLFGHIHEGYGWMQRGGVRFINASLLNEAYELVNRPVVFEL